MNDINRKIEELEQAIENLKKQFPAHSIPAGLMQQLDELETELAEARKLSMSTKQDKAFQDYYHEKWSVCYGCGRLNEHGLQIKSYWSENGEETIAHFKPKPYHTAVPGYVYGGLIASLIDCHATGTAAAAAYKAENRPMDSDPPLRYLTASLKVDYLKPTPIDTTLELRGKIKEIKGRKVIVEVELRAKGEVCAKGEVITVQVPPWLEQQLGIA